MNMASHRLLGCLQIHDPIDGIVTVNIPGAVTSVFRYPLGGREIDFAFDDERVPRRLPGRLPRGWGVRFGGFRFYPWVDPRSECGSMILVTASKERPTFRQRCGLAIPDGIFPHAALLRFDFNGLSSLRTEVTIGDEIVTTGTSCIKKRKVFSSMTKARTWVTEILRSHRDKKCPHCHALVDGE